MSMRQDWDYVAMSDYQADMKENADRAVTVIAAMRKRAEQAEQALAAVVLAAGGRVTVSDYDLGRLPKLTLEVSICLATRSRIFEVRT